MLFKYPMVLAKRKRKEPSHWLTIPLVANPGVFLWWWTRKWVVATYMPAATYIHRLLSSFIFSMKHLKNTQKLLLLITEHVHILNYIISIFLMISVSLSLINEIAFQSLNKINDSSAYLTIVPSRRKMKVQFNANHCFIHSVLWSYWHIPRFAKMV